MHVCTYVCGVYVFVYVYMEEKGKKEYDKAIYFTDRENNNLIGNSYFITSHEPQVPQRLAALRNQGGSLVCDFLAPSDIHRLYGHAVAPNGNQGWEETQKNAPMLAVLGISI